MNRLNISLTAIIILLIGVYIGIWTSPLKNSGSISVDYKDAYNQIAESKTALQKSVLHFYINDYCEIGSSRVVDFLYHGTRFQGVYCDKETILLLHDDFPPLPFFILDLNLEENDDKT